MWSISPQNQKSDWNLKYVLAKEQTYNNLNVYIQLDQTNSKKYAYKLYTSRHFLCRITYIFCIVIYSD